MRQFMKRAASLVLAAVLLLGAAPGLMVPQAEAAGTFSDVSDLVMAQNIEVLQLMGVVDGMSGSSFDPSGTLTRAQFCKMAVAAMGQGDRVNIYKNYTIFPDVRPGHWAAGYVNLASRLTVNGSEGGEGKGTRLISGFSDGTFGPDRTVTYGQAITILMRMLGYSDSDVSVVWPDGYIDQAMAIGLSDGVKLSGSSPINRGQAVRLFVNLLNCKTKSGGYYYNSLGGSVEAVLLDANAKNDAGERIMRTTQGDYLFEGNPGTGLLSGRKGHVVTKEEKAIAFIPSSEGSSKNITISLAETKAITDSSGMKYTVASSAKILRDDKDSDYENNFTTLRPGTLATIYINAAGRVESVFVGSTTSDDAVIIAKDGSTAGFALLTDRTDYKIFKHGENVSSKALKKFDVATYSSSNNTIYVSDNRITMYYQDAYPNPAAPTTIKVTGIEGDLEVLPCAIDTISQVKVGQAITLLLTENNKVAGVSTSNTARGNAIGFVDEKGSLELFNGLKVTASKELEKFKGQIVTVSSSNKTTLNISKVGAKDVRGDLNVKNRTVGGAGMAPDVRLYETVKGSELREIVWSDIEAEEIKSSEIAYTHKNYAGKVDILVLEDVTGEGYKYGRVFAEMSDDRNKPLKDHLGHDPKDNDWIPTYEQKATITVHCAQDGKDVQLAELYLTNGYMAGQWVGFSTKADAPNDLSRMFRLTAVRGVPAEAWREENGSVYFNDEFYTVGRGINNCCYNKDGGVWFRNLNAAIAYGGELTIFVDDNNVVRGVEVGK